MSGIVVGVDGSPHSRAALDWALEEAALRGSVLTVLAVTPAATGIYGFAVETYQISEDSLARVQEATQGFVNKALVRRTSGTPVSVTVRAVLGLPADELIRASEEAELLVVGARGVGGFARLIMGSVAAQVSHHARCPVVIVPGERGV